MFSGIRQRESHLLHASRLLRECELWDQLAFVFRAPPRSGAAHIVSFGAIRIEKRRAQAPPECQRKSQNARRGRAMAGQCERRVRGERSHGCSYTNTNRLQQICRYARVNSRRSKSPARKDGIYALIFLKGCLNCLGAGRGPRQASGAWGRRYHHSLFRYFSPIGIGGG